MGKKGTTGLSGAPGVEVSITSPQCNNDNSVGGLFAVNRNVTVMRLSV